MPVAVAHPAAIDDQRMIEQGTVAVRRGSQPVNEAGEQPHMVDVDLRVLQDRLRPVAVMRDRMMRFADAERRIRPLAHLARHHEGEHPRQIRLVGEREQIGPRIKRVVFETKVGGQIYEEHIDGRRFQWGKVLELDPPRRVRFTFHPSRPENTAQTIELIFHPEGTGTRLELIATDWEKWGKRAERARRGYQVGWRIVLHLWAGRMTMGMQLINAMGKVALFFQLIRHGGRAGLIDSAEGEVESA
jgi:hypothetical protein